MAAPGDAGLQHQGYQDAPQARGRMRMLAHAPFGARCSATIFWRFGLLLYDSPCSVLRHCSSFFEEAPEELLIADHQRRDEGKRKSRPGTLASTFEKEGEPGFWADPGGTPMTVMGEENSVAHSVP